MKTLPTAVSKWSLLLFLTSFSFSIYVFGQGGPSSLTAKERMTLERTSNVAMEEKIDALLAAMTLEEKVGQMMQLNNNMYSKQVSKATSPSAPPETLLEIDTNKLIYYLDSFHIGSFLNGVAVPAQNWYEYSQQLQEIGLRHSRLGIPLIYGIDHMHGANYLEEATIFPHSFNVGATFDPQFAANEAYVVGMETADLGHHWIFGPVMDIGRNPYWPRFYETYSEDPHLAGAMGAAYVHGLENNPATAPYKQAASVKHFLGYSDPDNGWDRSPATIDDQQLQEFHVPSFEAAIKAGTKTIMINGGEINGIPVNASHGLLTTLLRDQLGFTGVAVTDWEDVIRLHKTHKVTEDMKASTYTAIMAGVDMSMTPYETNFFGALVELVNEGAISMDRIDLSVSRILRLKMEIGLFENPLPRNDRFDRIGKEAHRAKAQAAAEESLVLVKNEEVLPLSAPRKIVLAGLNADSKKGLAGGWSQRWIPTEEKLFPEDMHTVYTALQEVFSGTEVQLSNAERITTDASGADVIIIATGENPYAETPGNISDLTLEEEQLSLIKAAQATGKPVVLLMIAGRPRIITDILEETDAFLWCGLPGFEGGEAIANVLSGKVNPSGKMSFSYPRETGHWFPYNHKNMDLFYDFDKSLSMTTIAPFGHGLSYTNYTYRDLTLSSNTLTESGTITATVTVRNDGKVAGREAVLWFISDEVGTYTRPVKELKHFEKQSLAPGEVRTFTFAIEPGQHLTYPDKLGNPMLEPGTFTLRVAGLSAQFELSRK